jgi:rod shape-determining protein MreD
VSWRRTAIAVSLLVLAAAVQTTLFVTLRPFDTAPALVLLLVIAVARRLGPVESVVLGFGSGLLLDLLSETALGLWSMVACAVAYATVRLRDRMEDDTVLVGVGVFVMSFGALALFALLGTIFGQKTLADVAVVRKMLLPALYNTVLAAMVLPLVTGLLTTRGFEDRGWQP